MTIRRMLLGGAIAIASLTAAAPSAGASTACVWVDPHGVCLSNPLPALPKLPGLPL
ncbi:MAG TPA: hypothetical protein VM262_08825 [Acidimicrobiales bacterium]|nr:hypothetical protein [Acidimicrobiales bacterium]